MPSKAHNKVVILSQDPLFNRRTDVVKIFGYHNKPEWPTRMIESPIDLTLSNTLGQGYIHFNGNAGGEDALNTDPCHRASAGNWDQRLYATAYTKFADAAKQGSAEWGMNILQARQALGTFTQLAITSAVAVTAFARAHKVGLKWLSSHLNATPNSVARQRRRRGRDLIRSREKRERVRIANEIWILDQVASTFLAYRYGIAPLMSDLSSTADILSKDFSDNVTLRKSATQSWNGSSDPWALHLKWSGQESVVLKATVQCSNPNLLLANRLGVTNPMYWAWDSTPWSYIIDWWLPIGSFLNNFTALVGLQLVDASITRQVSWTSHLTLAKDSPFTLRGDGVGFGKRKLRTTGPLPVPLTVPYGKGLSIQRAQNALAVIVQLLIPKRYK